MSDITKITNEAYREIFNSKPPKFPLFTTRSSVSLADQFSDPEDVDVHCHSNLSTITPLGTYDIPANGSLSVAFSSDVSKYYTKVYYTMQLIGTPPIASADMVPSIAVGLTGLIVTPTGSSKRVIIQVFAK